MLYFTLVAIIFRSNCNSLSTNGAISRFFHPISQTRNMIKMPTLNLKITPFIPAYTTDFLPIIFPAFHPFLRTHWFIGVFVDVFLILLEVNWRFNNVIHWMVPWQLPWLLNLEYNRLAELIVGFRLIIWISHCLITLWLDDKLWAASFGQFWIWILSLLIWILRRIGMVLLLILFEIRPKGDLIFYLRWFWKWLMLLFATAVNYCYNNQHYSHTSNCSDN